MLIKRKDAVFSHSADFGLSYVVKKSRESYFCVVFVCAVTGVLKMVKHVIIMKALLLYAAACKQFWQKNLHNAGFFH